MLPRADISLTPVGRVDAVQSVNTIGDPRQQAFQRALSELLGQPIKGEVLSRLTDGSYLVKVGATAARMLLPQGAQVGGQLPMTLVSLTPRPTFQINHANAGALAFTEAGPALLPGPAGAAARAEPLVYLEGAPPAAPGKGSASQPASLPAMAPGAEPDGGTPTSLSAAARQAAAQAMPGLPADDGPGHPSGLGAATSGIPVPRALAQALAMLRQSANLPAEHLPDIDPHATPSRLSGTAQLIANVLSTAHKAGPPLNAIATQRPLLSGADAPPEQVAQALRQAVSKSGLFYESHVAEWAAGQRTLPELKAEPQMQPALPQGDTAAASRGQPLDPATAQFINLQLSTQEQARLMWQGQIWPGQDLRWEVQRDPPRRDRPARDSEKDGAPPWRSGLVLRFPLLGEIKAEVVIAGEQLHVQIDTPSAEVSQLLREFAHTLSGALDAAGSPLSSLHIRALDGNHAGATRAASTVNRPGGPAEGGAA